MRRVRKAPLPPTATYAIGQPKAETSKKIVSQKKN